METLKKRSYFLQNSILISLIVLMISVSPISAFAEGKNSIKFMNPWIASGGWAMFWSCQDRLWPDEGVSGEVLDGKGSGPVVKAVATGSCEMGYTGIEAAFLGVQVGMPIKIVLIGEENDGTALITIKESGIKALKDFEGKRVGIFPHGHTSLLAKSMLKENNVDLTKIKFTNLNPGSGSQLLMRGKIDALAGIVGSQDMQLIRNGFDPVVFQIKDYGFSIYAFVVIINTDWEKKVGRDTVLKYLRGIARGFILLKTDVKQIVDDMIKYRPSMASSYDSILAEYYPRWQHRYKSDNMDIHGFGWIDKSKMEITQNVFFESKILKEKIGVEKYYTMDYLKDKSFSSLAMEYSRAKLDPNLKSYYDKFISKSK